MANILKNNKGIVLITVYFVVVVLLGLTSVIFMRSINESRLARRSADSLQAFYEAEAGISYAYYELAQAGFDWYTHDDNATPAADTPVVRAAGASIEIHYTVGGRGFQVKTYPEKDAFGARTGIVIVLSQATVNGISRTIEYRLGQESAYQYFFFFPDTHTFDTATFDGRNYGGIHVNGDIVLSNFPKFHYLTQLTCCGPDGSTTGYIKQYVYCGNTDDYGIYRDYQGNVDYPTTIAGPTHLDYYMYTASTAHFDRYISNRKTEFKSGDFTTDDVDDVTTSILNYYLEGANAEWSYDKYAGDPGADPERHYNLDYKEGNIPFRPLYDLAVYEMTSGHRSSTDYMNLVDETHTIDLVAHNPFLGTGTEKEMFEKMFEFPGQAVGHWNEFWTQWKSNHEDEMSYADGKNWERRFFQAAYNWGGGRGTPYYINYEWWEDMEYGTDRLDGDDTASAQVEDAQGNPIANRYFLNTEEQDTAFTDWLSDPNDDGNTADRLDKEGENKTLVQDRVQGATYKDPGGIISRQTDYQAIKEMAYADGVFIGSVSGTLFDPDADYTEEIQFYNAQHPAKNGSAYAPSNILTIDVHALKEKIESEMPNFNGVVYIDLENYQWSNTNFDQEATGIMLVNGERLPNGGLSIVTPHNVFIKGNYNLDPDGHRDTDENIIGRDHDDTEVINRVIDKFSYLGESISLEWQPAEIITNRAVYTLSEDFPEPQYMPIANDHNLQYYDERDYVPGQEFVSVHPTYPTDDWVPTPSETISAYSKVKKWFDYYKGGQPKPSGTWYEFIIDDKNWPSNTVYELDYDKPGEPGYGEIDEYILANDLRNNVSNHIEEIYDGTFNYETRHNGTSSVEPPDETVSKFNSVTEKHIYNTAIVTPYDTSPYVLESWDWKYDTEKKKYVEVNTPRVINGAFIQLPDDIAYKSDIPNSARYSRVHAPVNTFNYETRFGRGAAALDRPAANLTFGADSSWREIGSANF